MRSRSRIVWSAKNCGTMSGQGDASDNGTVFLLAPPTTAGGAWTETVLYHFSGAPE
jgi:hypothetical protein